MKNLLSLKTLIVLGFVISVIPLFLGVLYAAYGLKETAALGKIINSQVFQQTKTVGLVLQKTSDIERKARLFVLLSDPALRQPYERESYETVRTSFKQTLNDLLKLQIGNKIALLVNELTEKENLIYQQIINSESEDTLSLPVDDAFQDLRKSSNMLSTEFENHVEQTFYKLRQLSESLEKELLIKGTALLMASGLFVITLLIVLSRPMRQLETSIRRLGSDDLAKPIKVDGTADLRYLGDRLEWLRTHLLALESSKQHLMKNIAREIELPLQTIREAIQKLQPFSDGPAFQPGIVQQLDNNADKLNSLSEQLRHYSQFHSSQDMNTKQSIEMKTLLEQTLDQHKIALQAKSIKVKSLIRATTINGTPEQLRGILEQLLANAIQYSPTEGEIRIMLRDTNGRMELEIEDDGPGIAPEERPLVFEPFYRGRSAINHKVGNHCGLGLAMVREYVNNHQGTVEIFDAGRDHSGTRVRVQIPLTN